MRHIEANKKLRGLEQMREQPTTPITANWGRTANMRVKYRDSEGKTGELRGDQIEVGDLVAFTKLGGGWTQAEVVEVLPEQLRVRSYDTATASAGDDTRVVALADVEVQLNSADPRLGNRMAAWEIEIFLKEASVIAPVGHWPVAVIELTRRASADAAWRNLARLAKTLRASGWALIAKGVKPTLVEYVDWAISALGDDFKEREGRPPSQSSRSDARQLLSMLEEMARSPTLADEWLMIDKGDFIELQDVPDEGIDWEQAADEISEAREQLEGLTDEEWPARLKPSTAEPTIRSPAVQEALDRARSSREPAVTLSAPPFALDDAPLIAPPPGQGILGKFRAAPGRRVYDRVTKKPAEIAEVIDADTVKLTHGDMRDAADLFVEFKDTPNWARATDAEVADWKRDRRQRKRTATWRANCYKQAHEGRIISGGAGPGSSSRGGSTPTGPRRGLSGYPE